MDFVNIFFGMMHLFVAFVLIGISIPLVKGQISMNRMYGIRFKKSFESDENWYKINKYGGQQLIKWSIPLALFGVVSFFLPIEKSPVLFLLSLSFRCRINDTQNLEIGKMCQDNVIQLD